MVEIPPPARHFGTAQRREAKALAFLEVIATNSDRLINVLEELTTAQERLADAEERKAIALEGVARAQQVIGERLTDYIQKQFHSVR